MPHPTIKQFLSADEAGPLIGVTAERLIELARAGYAPHRLIDGKDPPWFEQPALRRWAKNNLWVTRQSVGTRAEHAYARSRLMPAFFQIEGLASWLRSVGGGP